MKTEFTRRTLLAGTAAVAAGTALAPMSSSDAAAPPVGKQAPGFYRYKVGSMEVTVVTDGVTATPLPDTYVTNAQKGDVGAAIRASYLPADKASHAYTPILVNTGGKLVAIDTGAGPGAFQQSKGAFGQYHSNLEAAGIDRNAVDVVIISHFHGDHIGGLVGADGKPSFPNAEVMVPQGEWAFWLDDGQMSRAPDAMKPAFQNIRRVFDAHGRKVTPYEADKELVPGITSISSPGHTVGHVSHMLTSGNDRVLVQADITAGMALLFVKNPDWQPSFDMDKPLAAQSRRKLYDMAVAERMLVQGYHFPFPSVGYIEKDGNGYRLVPANWNPTL
jgi:glyoxylase-like metal-dependent hydrolase (beta-lactamase superfamily II)